MIVKSVKCDKCGKTKGETNHWWELSRVMGNRILIGRLSTDPVDSCAHLCSESCLLQTISSKLEALK